MSQYWPSAEESRVTARVLAGTDRARAKRPVRTTRTDRSLARTEPGPLKIAMARPGAE